MEIQLTEGALERRGKLFIDEGLPQVLQHQMEKQLNQDQGNKLVISSCLIIFIKPPNQSEIHKMKDKGRRKC